MLPRLVFLLLLTILCKQTFAQQEDSLVLPNAVLYYYVYGQGTPILLLSGGPGISSHQEDDLAVHLSKTYSAILFDQRGTGKSWTKPFDSTTINVRQAVEDIELLRKHLKIDKLNISGHSWGGMLASAYTARFPDHVNSLIIIGGGEIDMAISTDVSKNINLRRQLADTTIYDYWSDSTNAKNDPIKAAYMLRKYRVYPYVYDTAKLNAVTIQVQRGIKNATMASLMWKDLRSTKMNVIAELNKYDRPVLVVFGWQDPAGITTLSQYMKAFPHAQFEGIHDCGHFCSVEQPNIFYSIVDSFLRRTLQ